MVTCIHRGSVSEFTVIVCGEFAKKTGVHDCAVFERCVTIENPKGDINSCVECDRLELPPKKTQPARSDPASKPRQSVRSAALSAGVDEDQFAQFVRDNGSPPGCYERRCWWLKKFEQKFGEALAERLRDELLGKG